MKTSTYFEKVVQCDSRRRVEYVNEVNNILESIGMDSCTWVYSGFYIDLENNRVVHTEMFSKHGEIYTLTMAAKDTTDYRTQPNTFIGFTKGEYRPSRTQEYAEKLAKWLSYRPIQRNIMYLE